MQSKGSISFRMLYKLAALMFIIVAAGILFLYESAKERYYAEIVNYSGKVRGDIQRAVKFYLYGDKKDLKLAIQEVEDYLRIIERDSKYLLIPALDRNTYYLPDKVKPCWKRLKELLLLPRTGENLKKIFDVSEKCWKAADETTDMYQRIVSRNLFILNSFFAILFFAAVGIIFLLIKIIVFEVNQKLEKRASIDNLTGALNRASLLEAYSDLSQKEKSYPISLIVFDLDHFKRINDTYGHNIGDEVLKRVTAEVKKHIRKTDILGRWGGEEFVIVLPHTDLEAAKRLAERLRKLIEGLKILPDGAKVTSSFGITEILPCETFKKAFERADKALYRAKQKGRNRIEIEPPERC